MKDKEAQQIRQRRKPLQRTMKKQNENNQFLLVNPDQLFLFKNKIINLCVCMIALNTPFSNM